MTVRLLVVLSVFAVACSASPIKHPRPPPPLPVPARQRRRRRARRLPPTTQAQTRSPSLGACHVARRRDIFESFSDAGTTTCFEATPDARGIVIALHGTGGTSSSLAQEAWNGELRPRGGAPRLRPHDPRVPSNGPHAAAVGCAVGDRRLGSHRGLVDLFEKKAKLPATTPLFIVGMSQGRRCSAHCRRRS